MRTSNENESNNFLQEDQIISPISPNYNNDYEDSPNTKLIMTEYDNRKNFTKSKIPLSYKNLIKSYSNDRKRYYNIYEKRKRGIPSFYLKHTYLKNQENFNKYLKKNVNNKGLKLEGNKDYEDIPVNEYINEIEDYKENINKLIKHNDWFYIYPDENENNVNKMKLTPLPSKSRLLMETNKEKNDFNFAERNAVMMRRIEYTHSLISKNGKKEEKERLDKEREKIYLIMKSAVLTIEDWWVKILEKQKKRQKHFNFFLEENKEKINDFFIYLDNIFSFKNNKDEKRKVYIEFFRNLIKIRDKENRKRNKSDNNIIIPNVNRDNQEPENLGSNHMVDIWKSEENLLKNSNNNTSSNYYRYQTENNFNKTNKLKNSKSPKQLYHYMDNSTNEMVIYRNNNSNYKNIISENLSNRRSLKMGIINPNKNNSKSMRINDLKDSQSPYSYHNNLNNYFNKNQINDNRKKMNKNNNINSNRFAPKNSKEKIKNIEEKFRYVLEKSKDYLNQENNKGNQKVNKKPNNYKKINNFKDIQNNFIEGNNNKDFIKNKPLSTYNSNDKLNRKSLNNNNSNNNYMNHGDDNYSNNNNRNNQYSKNSEESGKKIKMIVNDDFQDLNFNNEKGGKNPNKTFQKYIYQNKNNNGFNTLGNEEKDFNLNNEQENNNKAYNQFNNINNKNKLFENLLEEENNNQKKIKIIIMKKITIIKR